MFKPHLHFKRIVFLLAGFSCFNLFAEPLDSYLTCAQNPVLQKERSLELQRLVDADQREREDWIMKSDDEQFQLMQNDLIRRKRVGEIFGEGCFKTVADYAAASLIYQHGDVPDHYYQAFVWANRAVALGDVEQKHLVALTIDRYLVSIGKKQLFGSQAFSENAGACACLEQVENSFPDRTRINYSGMSLADRYEWLASINEGKQCPNTECLKPLTPTPHDSIPGFW